MKCETCAYYFLDELKDGYCVNADSEYCTEWVEPEFSCESYEKKKAQPKI